MPHPIPSPSELISTLKRSALPTVITEGYEDYLVFRRLEDNLRDRGISFLPAGGKTAVLEIFRRRCEFSNVQTAFIVDRDFWLFCGTPEDYLDDKIIQTDGYSIENDLYADGHLEQMLLAHERARFDVDCNVVCEWFSYVVRCHIEGHTVAFDLHPNQILLGPGTLNPAILAAGYAPCPILLPQLQACYVKFLRGKTLLALLVKFLSAPGRVPRHNSRALMDYAAVSHGPKIAAIQKAIEEIFV